MKGNQKVSSIYPFSALQLIPFTLEESTGCTNKAAKSANKAPRNPSSYFFISCFTVSVISTINTPEFSNDFIILIIPFISSFEIKKVNPFLALTGPFSLIFFFFFSNLFIVF